MSKPLEQHKLEGTYRNDRHADQFDVPLMGRCPTPPKNLNDRAQEYWRKKCLELIDNNILTRIDLDTLATYCHLMSVHDEWMEKYNNALTDELKTKYLKLLNETLKYLNPIGKDFGFSPMARTKIKVQKKEQTDPFNDL